MQKIIKYIIAIAIIVLFFGAGYISGCIHSNRKNKILEGQNTELRESISNYSNELRQSERERFELNKRIENLKSEIDGLQGELSEIIDSSGRIESRFRNLYGERSDTGQRIQEIRNGLGELNSEIHSYIEEAENQ